MPAQTAFEQQLDRVGEDLGLRVLFDEHNGYAFAHSTDKVEALERQATSPASERIMTFAYNADPQAPETQLVTSVTPDRAQIGGQAPIPIRSDYT